MHKVSFHNRIAGYSFPVQYFARRLPELLLAVSTNNFARFCVPVWVCISARKKVSHEARNVPTQIFGHFHKRGTGWQKGGFRTGDPVPHIVYFSGRKGREYTRVWLHNLPIMHVSCVAHVDSRRRDYVEFMLRVPDEYRVTAAAEERCCKNFGREFRCTRVIAHKIGRR